MQKDTFALISMTALLVFCAASHATTETDWPNELYCTSSNHDSASVNYSALAVNPLTRTPVVATASVEFYAVKVYLHEKTAAAWSCELAATYTRAFPIAVAEIDLAVDSSGNPGIVLVINVGFGYTYTLDIMYLRRIGTQWSSHQLFHKDKPECDIIPADYFGANAEITYDAHDIGCISYSAQWNPGPDSESWAYGLWYRIATGSTVGPEYEITNDFGQCYDHLSADATDDNHYVFLTQGFGWLVKYFVVSVDPYTLATTYEPCATGFSGFVRSVAATDDVLAGDDTLSLTYWNGAEHFRTSNEPFSTWSEPEQLSGINALVPQGMAVPTYVTKSSEEGPLFLYGKPGTAWEQITGHAWSHGTEVNWDWRHTLSAAVNPGASIPFVLYGRRILYPPFPSQISVVVIDGDTEEVLSSDDIYTIYAMNRSDSQPYTFSGPAYFADLSLSRYSDAVGGEVHFLHSLPCELPGHHWFIRVDAPDYEQGSSRTIPEQLECLGVSETLYIVVYPEECGRSDNAVGDSTGYFHALVPGAFALVLTLLSIPVYRKFHRQS